MRYVLGEANESRPTTVLFTADIRKYEGFWEALIMWKLIIFEKNGKYVLHVLDDMVVSFTFSNIKNGVLKLLGVL